MKKEGHNEKESIHDGDLNIADGSWDSDFNDDKATVSVKGIKEGTTKIKFTQTYNSYTMEVEVVVKPAAYQSEYERLVAYIKQNGSTSSRGKYLYMYNKGDLYTITYNNSEQQLEFESLSESQKYYCLVEFKPEYVADVGCIYKLSSSKSYYGFGSISPSTYYSGIYVSFTISGTTSSSNISTLSSNFREVLKLTMQAAAMILFNHGFNINSIGFPNYR